MGKWLLGFLTAIWVLYGVFQLGIPDGLKAMIALSWVGICAAVAIRWTP